MRATTIAIKVANDNKASNKASIPLPLSASLLSFLPMCLKYNPRAIFTTTAMAIKMNDQSSKVGIAPSMIEIIDSTIAADPAIKIMTLIMRLVKYSIRPCPYGC